MEPTKMQLRFSSVSHLTIATGKRGKKKKKRSSRNRFDTSLEKKIFFHMQQQRGGIGGGRMCEGTMACILLMLSVH